MAVSISFISAGNQGARSIVFLHGGGASGWMWDPVISRMQDFHCLVPDLPEHGHSIDVKPFSIPFAAAQVAELIREKAHGTRAVVVGMSEGAQVAVQLLADAPERIERALISSALLLPMPGMNWMRSVRSLSWVYRLTVAPFKNNEWWMRVNMKNSASVPLEYFPQYKELFQLTHESQFINVMLANQQFRIPENLSAAVCPVLVIAGQKEYAVMKESARLLAAALPNAQAYLLNLGRDSSLAKEHNWVMNAPDLFAHTLRGFIDGAPLPQNLSPLI